MNKKIGHRMIFLLIWAFVLTGCSAGTGQTETETETDMPQNLSLNESQMQSICELATLECYYHNTAKFDSEKKVLFWNTSKKLWIEYSGIVKVGIDVGELEMDVKGNVVTITIPEAKVLSCHVDDTSLSADNFYSETKGLGSGSIGAEEQTKAFQAAQDGMLSTVQEDTSLLLQARTRAQTLLENYVKNVSEAMGVSYEIRWEIKSKEE